MVIKLKWKISVRSQVFLHILIQTGAMGIFLPRSPGHQGNPLSIHTLHTYCWNVKWDENGLMGIIFAPYNQTQAPWKKYTAKQLHLRLYKSTPVFKVSLAWAFTYIVFRSEFKTFFIFNECWQIEQRKFKSNDDWNKFSTRLWDDTVREIVTQWMRGFGLSTRN
jgi:hypothetical protein